MKRTPIPFKTIGLQVYARHNPAYGRRLRLSSGRRSGTHSVWRKGQLARRLPHGVRAEKAELRRLAAFVATAQRGPFAMGENGISTHEFHKDGERYVARLNTKNKADDERADAPEGAFGAFTLANGRRNGWVVNCSSPFYNPSRFMILLK